GDFDRLHAGLEFGAQSDDANVRRQARGGADLLRALALQYYVGDLIRRAGLGEVQAERAAFDDLLGAAAVVDLGHDVRASRQLVRRTGRETHVTMPGRPTADPLAGFLYGEKCCADYAIIAWHEFDSGHAALGSEPW